MEGQPNLTPSDNHSNNSVDILEDVTSGDPHDMKSRSLEISLPQSIDARLVAALVRFAIHLDQEPGRYTGEVSNVAANRMLAAEFNPIGSQAKRTP